MHINNTNAFETEAKKLRLYINTLPNFRHLILQRLMSLYGSDFSSYPKDILTEHPFTLPYLKLMLKDNTLDMNHEVFAVHNIAEHDSTRLYIEALLMCSDTTYETLIKQTRLTPEIFAFYAYMLFDIKVFKTDFDVLAYIETLLTKKEQTIKWLGFKTSHEIIDFMYGKACVKLSMQSLAKTLAFDAAIKGLYSMFYTYDSEEALRLSNWGAKAMNYITSIRNTFKDDKVGDTINDIVMKLKFNPLSSETIEQKTIDNLTKLV
jgi:hypothetical protein